MNSKMFLRLVGLTTAFILVIGVACSQTKTQVAKKPEVKASASKTHAIMGYLQTRDHKITIKADGLYTIADKDGKVLAENVSLKDLQASNPRLHGILERAVASPDAPGDNATRDARDRPSILLPHNGARGLHATIGHERSASGIGIHHNDAGK
jgi:hypothetical protein